MSQRNKQYRKKTRKETRELDKTPPGSAPIGRIPQAVSASILSNPLQMRLHGKSRRRLQRNRGLAVPVERTVPKNFAVRAAVKLTKLTLAKLFRRQAQAARRASTCKYLIADLSPDSQFALKLKSLQTYQLSLLKQITAEINSRNHEKTT